MIVPVKVPSAETVDKRQWITNSHRSVDRCPPCHSHKLSQPGSIACSLNALRRKMNLLCMVTLAGPRFEQAVAITQLTIGDRDCFVSEPPSIHILSCHWVLRLKNQSFPPWRE